MAITIGGDIMQHKTIIFLMTIIVGSFSYAQQDDGYEQELSKTAQLLITKTKQNDVDGVAALLAYYPSVTDVARALQKIGHHRITRDAQEATALLLAMYYIANAYVHSAVQDLYLDILLFNNYYDSQENFNPVDPDAVKFTPDFVKKIERLLYIEESNAVKKRLAAHITRGYTYTWYSSGFEEPCVNVTHGRKNMTIRNAAVGIIVVGAATALAHIIRGYRKAQ